MKKKENQSYGENPKEDILLVKEYLSRCSCVASSSLAIRVAMRALDEELKKLDRDERLRLKFTTQEDDNGGKTNTKNEKKEMNHDYNDNGNWASMQSSSSLSAGALNDRNTKDLSNRDKKERGINSNDIHMNDRGQYMDDSEFHDWQSIGPQEPQQQQQEDGNPYFLGDETTTTSSTTIGSPSSFGAKVVRTALVEMSQAGTKVSTPTAALALILHSALVSDFIGFKCTGIPEDICCFKTDDVQEKKKYMSTTYDDETKTKGFAPPIRELPRGVFVPDNWDRHASLWTGNQKENELFQSQSQSQSQHWVVLRYSKTGMPATVLRVETNTATATAIATDNVKNNNEEFMRIYGLQQHDDSGDIVTVSFGPLGGEPCQLIFPIHEHVNVDGLQSALIHNQQRLPLDHQSLGVSPSLHYKALVKLMTQFCNVADLGGVVDDDYGASRNRESDRIAEHYTKNSVPISLPIDRQQLQWEQQRLEARRPPTLEDLQSDTMRRYHPPLGEGDFPDDLLPSGIPVPGFADPLRIGGNRNGNGNGTTGNLMGPNHPMFRSPHFDRNDDDGVGNDYYDEHDNNDFILPCGLGMQPRFDPYYPPGLGGGRFPMPGRYGRARGRGRGRRGGGRYYGGGDPNPDHQRPPNTFGNNGNGGGGNDSMFM